jgi:hypothetical protein
VTEVGSCGRTSGLTVDCCYSSVVGRPRSKKALTIDVGAAAPSHPPVAKIREEQHHIVTRSEEEPCLLVVYIYLGLSPGPWFHI